MPIIDRPGAKVHYQISGQGQSLLLGHSLLCDARMWEHVIPKLEEHFQVIAIDARGHRHSSCEWPFSLWDLANDWLAIMDHEGIDQAHMAGLSMGGMTAMRLALTNPEPVT